MSSVRVRRSWYHMWTIFCSLCVVGQEGPSHGVCVEILTEFRQTTLTISRKKRHLQLTDTNAQVSPMNGTP